MRQEKGKGKEREMGENRREDYTYCSFHDHCFRPSRVCVCVCVVEL